MPHRTQRRGCSDVHAIEMARNCQRSVSLPEPNLVGEQRTAMSLYHVQQAVHTEQLMRLQC
jgi:hypothetical protein